MNEAPNSESWDACPAGTLQRIVRHRRRSRQIKRATLAAVPLAVILLFVGILRPGLFPPNLTCSHVVAQLPAYLAGELSWSEGRAVRKHLSHCHHCSQTFDELARSLAVRLLTQFDLIARVEPDAYRLTAAASRSG